MKDGEPYDSDEDDDHLFEDAADFTPAFHLAAKKIISAQKEGQDLAIEDDEETK